MINKSKGDIAYEKIGDINQNLYSILSQINASYKHYSASIVFDDSPYTLCDFDSKAKSIITLCITQQSSGDIILYHNDIAIAKLYPQATVLMSIECQEKNTIKLVGTGECQISYSICGNIKNNITNTIKLFSVKDKVLVCKNSNNTCVVDVIDSASYSLYPDCQKSTYNIEKVIDCKVILYNNIETYALLCKGEKTTLYIGNFDDCIVLPDDTIAISSISSNGYAYMTNQSIVVVTDSTQSYTLNLSQKKKILGTNYIADMEYQTQFYYIDYSGVMGTITLTDRDVIDTSIIRLQGNDFDVIYYNGQNALCLFGTRGTNIYKFDGISNAYVSLSSIATNKNISIIGSDIVTFSNDFIASIKAM